MTRLPLRTRLRLKGLRWRHYWPFQWAHKPLCSRFRRDTIRVGKLHLCRSCACLYTGILAGIVIGIYASDAILSHVPALALAALTIAVASAPRFYSRLSRPLRDLLRAAAGLAAGCTLELLPAAPLWSSATLIALLATALHYRRQRARRRSQACAGCPELGSESVCSGYANQAVRLRAYEEAATNAILAGGYEPARQ